MKFGNLRERVSRNSEVRATAKRLKSRENLFGNEAAETHLRNFKSTIFALGMTREIQRYFHWN